MREDPWHQANRKWNHQPTCGDDVSTEEQIRPTASAEIILPDAALEAALAAAAKGSAARPVEDIDTGYESVVVDGENPLTGFAEAVRDLSFEWAKPLASTPLTLVRNRDSEMEALEARRQTAISALKDAIAKADGEERDDLEQALERLESAKNPGEIQAALTVAQSTLSREAAGSGSKAAGGGMDDINARHREMYANDPVYRAAVDRFVESSETRLDASQARERQLDRLAQQLGIETPGADGAVEDARRALERAKHGSPEERGKAELDLHKALEERNIQRERIAREKGEHGAAGQFGDGARDNRSDIQKTMEDLRKWQEEFIKAQRRQMEQQGRSEAEIRERLRAQQQWFDQRNAAIERSGDVQSARREVDRRRGETESLQQRNQEADATRSSTEPPTPGQNASATNGTGGAGQSVAARENTITVASDTNAAGVRNQRPAPALAGQETVATYSPTEANPAENHAPGETPIVIASNTPSSPRTR